jgi:O-antigen ligase
MWMASTAVVALVGVSSLVLFYAGVRSQSVNFALERFGSLPPGNYPRLRATFSNANMMCSYMGIGLMFLPLVKALGWIRTAWYGAVSAAAWLTALLSLSPGIGGLFLARGLWEWQRRGDDPRRRLAAAAALTVGIGVAVAFFLAILVEPSPRGDGSGMTVMGRHVEASPRLRLWRKSFQQIAEHPVIGAGVGTSLEPLEYATASGQVQRLTDPHNVWLSVSVQSGLVGLASFVMLVAYVWWCARPLPSDASRTGLTKLALRGAFVSVLLYQGLSGSFEDARHVWVLMGLMVCVGDDL